MHFLPTADQVDLQRGVRDLLDSRFTLEHLPHGYDANLWSALAETGVFSLRTDLELGWVESVLVFEELGRACVPGPLVGTFLADGVGEGPVAVVEPDQAPLLVAHLDVAASLLVLGEEPIITRPVTGTQLNDPLDPLTPLHELAAAPTEPIASLPVTSDQARRAGALLTAALQVGLASRMTELAVAYAKEREQFGKTIGSFQAVKHICADMFVKTELARASLHSAAVLLDDPEVGNSARAVAGAKILADEAASTNGRACVQVHGGMGFTWEVPVHYFVKRAWLHATEFGTAEDHAEDLAALL
ncbi:MAG: acyl-CoA dehydrogenase [Frankiaceae bacterium]|nr:acyl-CoA dehydrogenase [Frankiaceae bacterium]MBV9871064.1 acyl-CoA dehydrogenase [Frankiaceae bacterium]